MDPLAFEHHLTSPQGHRHHPARAHTVITRGGACGDEVTFSVAVKDDRVTDAGFTARGCGAATAAASAAVTLVRGAPILEAARVGPHEIAAELGGLSPAKRHAADVASEGLARALGAAVRAEAQLGHDPARTLVAMSGGVDSAVAAHLTVQDGPAVAVTLELWADTENDAEGSCCSASAVAQARALAHQMELPHFTIDLKQEFRQGVVDPFIAGYAQGETPNPCVGCNGHVRLDAMIQLADRLGCATLTTGHYARIAEQTDADGPLLRVAADPAKDQTYMLAALQPASLARLRFPLGDLHKHEVRQIAATAGLPVAAKADSQDLCFLAGTTRQRFLARHGNIASQPGEIITQDGTHVGTHEGQHLFTVGQRRGLHIHHAEPLYVLDKQADTGTVVVGTRPQLRTDRVAIRAARLHRDGARVDRVKLRYRSRPLPARVLDDPAPGRHRALALSLQDHAEGPAPGQLACLMDGDLVVGWGTITRS